MVGFGRRPSRAEDVMESKPCVGFLVVARIRVHVDECWSVFW